MDRHQPEGRDADDHAARGALRLAPDLGDDPGLQKDGVEAHLQELLAATPHAIEAGLTLVRREYPTAIGPIDLVCRDADGHVVAVEVKRRGEIDGVEQLARYIERLHLDSSLGDGARRVRRPVVKPQARVLAEARGFRWVEVDYDELRGLAPTTSGCSDVTRLRFAAGHAARSTGVIARAKGEPVTIETIVVPDPGPGEAVVADPGLRRVPHRPALPRGRHQRRLPVPARPRGGRHRRGGRRRRHRRRARRLRDPQLAGRVRQLPGVPRGEPWYCFATHNATQKMTLTDGTVLSPALGIGAFADKTLVAAGQCTKVDPEAPATAAGLLGCGVMAGLGAAINTGGVTRGDSVAVFGCGGVGDAAIAGSALAGASTIIAVDIDDRKLAWAKEFGATHTCNSTTTDPVEFIKSVTGGFGADVCIEAIGNPTVYRQAFEARDLAGTVVLVGVPRPDDVHRAAVHRGVRPRRRAQVELVRRLPAVARLPDADRPVPAGPARPRPLRHRGDRPRRRRGGVPQDGARRGAALRRRDRDAGRVVSAIGASVCGPDQHVRPGADG